jgi:hypothetical protein
MTVARRLTRLCLAVLAAGVVISAAGPAWAQETGRFTGTVFDPSGAVVPGATVVVKNERTGEARTVTSAADGRYLVPGLKPSVYTIQVKVGDFAPLEFTGLQVGASQEFPLDLTLAAAGVNETVTVTATAATLDLSSARVGVNVSEREVQNLPVNGRQMSQLMLQAPGSQNAGTGTWNDVRFSGRANQQNVIKFDGVEGSAIIDASPGNLGGQIPTPFKLQASLENVQEFRVESNNYPAEFGTGTGGQVSVVTKSGSNNWRGGFFEYYRNDAMDARNYFDDLRNNDGTVQSAGAKSELRQHQYGGSFGGAILRDRAFFFGSYEGYRLDAGVNFIEAAPSSAAWNRAVPTIAALRPGFTAPGANLLAGASTNTDFDIYQLQGIEEVRENAISARIDFRFNSQWSSYGRVFHDRGTQSRPEGISGRVVDVINRPTNAIYNVQGVFGSNLNEARIGFNQPNASIRGVAPTVAGTDFSALTINLTGSVANTGIAGQTGSSGIVVPGGLVRASSATNGRASEYKPYSVAFADTLSLTRGSHLTKIGADVRLVRMEMDQQGGTTYTFPNVTAFLANQPSAIQYLGDISAPSVFNSGVSGPRRTHQQYYTAFAQDEFHLRSNVTLNYGLRYEYYTPLKVVDNGVVKFNIETGEIDPNTSQLHGARKDNVQPRASVTWAPGRTVFKSGFGIFVGPGQGEDLIQPIESDRVSTTLSTGPLLAFPINQDALVSNFTSNPNNRNYQPRAYAKEYEIPERVYQYTASMQQDLGRGFSASAAYVGSQGRNLFLRSVANQVVAVQTNPAPTSAAFVVREFSLVTCSDGQVARGALCPAGSTISRVDNPYAEVDFKTSGGHDNYNAMMLSLNRRANNGIAMNAQYTLGRSRGTSGGSNEANTAANNARTAQEFEYENGYNNFDVRHTFNLSLLYSTPGTGWLGNWNMGGILNARSGLPIPVQIVRPDIVYRDTATGLFYTGQAAGREAVINTPGGGASRNVRRPDLIPGVDPFIKDGGLLFLNPAAFATPAPGSFGNLERNAIHGPGFRQIDAFIAKRLPMGGRTNVELRFEVFNVFDTVNYANPSGTLNAALPANPGAANTVQPGQPYTAAAAGPGFGRLSSTVGRTVGLGTPRQLQLAARFSF